MVWACRSPDYVILKGTAVGSKCTGLMNDYTNLDEAYFTIALCNGIQDSLGF